MLRTVPAELSHEVLAQEPTRKQHTQAWVQQELTCSLVTLSASSVRTRSPSLNLTCSSCSCASTFLRLCSESPLPCSRAFTSLASSPRSFSRVCFAFSRVAFTWKRRQGCGEYPVSGMCLDFLKPLKRQGL